MTPEARLIAHLRRAPEPAPDAGQDELVDLFDGLDPGSKKALMRCIGGLMIRATKAALDKKAGRKKAPAEAGASLV